MHEVIAPLIAGHVGNVLEVFTGHSHVVRHLADHSGAVAGVCADVSVVAHLRSAAPTLTWWHENPVTMQLPNRFDVIVVGDRVLEQVAPEHRRSIVHNVVQHLVPGGVLVAQFAPSHDRNAFTIDEFDALCTDCELSPISRQQDGPLMLMVSRRTDRFTIHDLVYEARQHFTRTTAHELASQLGGPERPLVVDTRTQTDRARFGVIDGSIHVPRTVLEWHLDPANGYRHPAVTSLEQPMVIVCNRGYSSSLGAASLLRLGFTAVTDLVGGVHAWIETGYPVVPADHDHLDL